MEVLYQFQENLLRTVSDSFFRFLFDKINWRQRMLAVKGPRGAGKSTMLLQYLKYRLTEQPNKALYITLDHHWFYTHSLVDTTDTFYKNGGRFLLIDEVHKYPRWSSELKNIYDAYPDLQVIFTASSALDIYRGEADLSRRVITYELPGLSFREFLGLTGQFSAEVLTLQQIKEVHQSFARNFCQALQPLPAFRNYLRYGYLPIFTEGSPVEVPIRLEQVLNAVIESDLSSIEQYTPATAYKVKKLMGVLAESVPFKPNVAALARKLDASRDSIYAWLSHLQKARLLNLLGATGKGVALLQKPEKVFLENTNLSYALKANPDVGTLRETFLLNQLVNAGLEVLLPKTGDFLAERTYIEVGGKQKEFSQVNDQKDFLVASDDLEIGHDKRVPLWLFGFMY